MSEEIKTYSMLMLDELKKLNRQIAQANILKAIELIVTHGIETTDKLDKKIEAFILSFLLTDKIV